MREGVLSVWAVGRSAGLVGVEGIDDVTEFLTLTLVPAVGARGRSGPTVVIRA